MHLLRVTCHDFRCLQEIDFQPEPGVNAIRGDNAQGKTSVLEAILFVTTSKSHRTVQEAELARHDAEGFRLQAWARRKDRDVTLEANWWKGAKRIKVNGVAQTRVSDVLGKVNTVFFSPEDVMLIKGGASFRRRFLDMALSQVDGVYLNALQRYRQSLRQRNELLRAAKPDADQLDAFEAQLEQSGNLLRERRAEFAARLGQFAAAKYHAIAQDESFDIAYEPNIPLGESIAELLARHRLVDIKRKTTLRGPHRDDLRFLIAGQPARNYASQGQQKTAALSAKLAELELVRERVGEYPVLMLDEVLAELDEARTRRLFEAIDDAVQCIVTTTVRSPQTQALGAQWPSYRVERGHLEKE
ncbi:MAG: replication and repair protein RecF [Candidatus Hydrogenedentes bacterium]|nr:replication and repair protein RecF [Candidatus Hydrogenedentota bacterium]